MWCQFSCGQRMPRKRLALFKSVLFKEELCHEFNKRFNASWFDLCITRATDFIISAHGLF